MARAGRGNIVPEDGGRLADMVPTWAQEQLRYAEWWSPFRQIMNYVHLRRTRAAVMYCLPVGFAALGWYTWVLYMRLAQIPFYLKLSKGPAFGLDMVAFAVCCLPGVLYSILGILVSTRVAALMGPTAAVYVSGTCLALHITEFVLSLHTAMGEIYRLVWFYWNYKRYLTHVFDATIQQYTAGNETVQVVLGLAWNPPLNGFLTIVTVTLLSVYIQYQFLDICRSFFRQVKAGGTGWTLDSAETLVKHAKQLEKMPTEGAMDPAEDQGADMTQALGLLGDTLQGGAARLSIQQRLLAGGAGPEPEGLFGVPAGGLRKRSSPNDDIESQTDELGHPLVGSPTPLSPTHQENLSALQHALAKRGGSPTDVEVVLPPHLLQYFVTLSEAEQQEFLEMTAQSIRGEKPVTKKSSLLIE